MISFQLVHAALTVSYQLVHLVSVTLRNLRTRRHTYEWIITLNNVITLFNSFKIHVQYCFNHCHRFRSVASVRCLPLATVKILKLNFGFL